MGSIRRRVSRLEEAAHAGTLPAHWNPDEWPTNDQLAEVVDYVDFHRRFGTVAVCTSRQVNLLGIATAHEQLGGAGEWVAPSGVVITLTENEDDTFGAELSANVAIEDLPDDVREHVKRMAPERQAERDRWLYERWRGERGEGGIADA